MCRDLLVILLMILLSACSDDATSQSEANSQSNSAEQPSTAVSYKMISSVQGEDDASLPMGYWQSVISYPQIEGKLDSAVIETINSRITELSKEYSCEQHGDYSFAAEVKRLDAGLFSMAYEVMWMCPGMPSPDSAMGALNYNLASGQPIELVSEFRDKEAYNAFQAKVRGKIQAAQQASPECPALESYLDYYLTDTSIVLMMDMPRHEDSGCNSEIEISLESIGPLLAADSILQ